MDTTLRDIRDLNLEGRRVFIRVDFNVPMTENGDEAGTITDDTRIRAAIPTILFAKKAGAKIILASHLGRPKGKPDARYSMVPVGERLAELTGLEVLVPDDCIGEGPRHLAANLRDNQIVLLENLRFHEAEEKNDEAFARKLAELCDVYVNDAFGAAHRAHASVEALPRLIRERGAGLLMKREVEMLSNNLQKPARPFVAVLGGAKVSDKIGVVESLLTTCDELIIGGAMAYTFLAAKGVSLGNSRVESDKIALARRALAKAEARKVRVLLPVDHVVVHEVNEKAKTQIGVNEGFPPEGIAVDIGPITAEHFASVVRQAKTVFWNGPMGIFEMKPFAAGTQAIARAMAECEGITIVGGGDSVAAIQQMGLADKVTHVSTGGGASLELIEGQELPGIEALRERKKANTNQP